MKIKKALILSGVAFAALMPQDGYAISAKESKAKLKALENRVAAQEAEQKVLRDEKSGFTSFYNHMNEAIFHSGRLTNHQQGGQPLYQATQPLLIMNLLDLYDDLIAVDDVRFQEQGQNGQPVNWSGKNVIARFLLHLGAVDVLNGDPNLQRVIAIIETEYPAGGDQPPDAMDLTQQQDRQNLRGWLLRYLPLMRDAYLQQFAQ